MFQPEEIKETRSGSSGSIGSGDSGIGVITPAQSKFSTTTGPVINDMMSEMAATLARR